MRRVQVDPDRPSLDMPVAYDFAIAPPPKGHVIKSRVLHPRISSKAYIRAVEVGFDPIEGQLEVRVVWSQPR